MHSLLDTLNLYSNLIIAILTIVTIYFAHRSLRSNQAAIRLNALPIFFPKVTILKKTTKLTLENRSNYPAYDVDIWFIGEFYQNEFPYQSLLSKDGKDKVEIDFSKGECSDSEHYGVADRINHYAFPPKAKCVISLDFLFPPETAQLVIQFKDSMGFNYIYQSWFFLEENGEELKLGFLSSSFRLVRRIDWPNFPAHKDHLDDIYVGIKYHPVLVRPILYILRTWTFLIQKINFSLYLDKDTKDTLSRTFSSGYQKINQKITLEGRGEFFDL